MPPGHGAPAAEPPSHGPQSEEEIFAALCRAVRAAGTPNDSGFKRPDSLQLQAQLEAKDVEQHARKMLLHVLLNQRRSWVEALTGLVQQYDTELNVRVAFYREDARGVEIQNYPLQKPTETIQELMAHMRRLQHQNYNPVSFFLARRGQLPEDWSTNRSSVSRLYGDGRLVTEVVPSTHCVVMVIRREQMLDIGVFVAPSEQVVVASGAVPAQELPGAEWLQHPELPASLDRAQVASVAAAVGGSALPSLPARPPAGCRLATAACEALVQQVDTAWAAEHCGAALLTKSRSYAPRTLADSVRSGSLRHDFKLLLTPAALAAAVGDEAYAAILALLDTLAPDGQRAPDVIAVRRTEACGRWIGFHTDRAAATVQVSAMSLCLLWARGGRKCGEQWHR